MGRKIPPVCRLALIISLFYLVSGIYPAEGASIIDHLYFDPNPVRIAIVSGDGQVSGMSTALPEPFVVKVLGNGDHPLPWIGVRFVVTGGGGTLTQNPQTDIAGREAITIRTNRNGEAKITLILGKTKGINTVEARVNGLKSAIFTATSNSAPNLNPIGDKWVDENSELKFTVSATDPDPGDPVFLSVASLPPNANFNTSTGVFSFIPDKTQAGEYQVTFFASDGTLVDSETITITVRNFNRPPSLNPIGNHIVNENSELTIIISATDPDGDKLTFAASGMPPDAVLEQQGYSQAIFKWKPGFDVAPPEGSINRPITFTVSDTSGRTDAKQIIITVMDIEPPPAPDILALPLLMDFGNVPVTESADRAFLIYNNGEQPLNISQIVPSDPQFAIIAYSQIAGQFAVVSYSEADGKFIIEGYIDGDDSSSITAYSEVDDELITVTYSEIWNGFQISDESASFAVATYSETDTGFVDVAYPEIAPGDSLLVITRFSPSSKGIKVGQLFVISNDPDQPVTPIDVQGEAVQTPDISISPLGIDFGDVSVGQSTNGIINIRNDGNALLKILDVISGDPQFVVSNHYDVGIGGQIAIIVTFTPSSTGEITTLLNIISDDPDEPVIQVGLKGNGTDPPISDIRVSPTSLYLGEVEVGQSLQGTLNIHNDGGAALQISNITSSKDQFTVSNHSDVPPGGQIAIIVTFTPSSPGEETATLSIASNDPDEPVIHLAIQGKGTEPPASDIRATLDSINMGEVEIGQSSQGTFRIYNDGDAKLLIHNMVSSNSQFTVSDHSDINPGGHVTVIVTFTPEISGSKTATLSIYSNDPDESVLRVTIQGTGVKIPAPDIRIWPTSVSFGGVEIGESSDRWLWIYNDGDATLHITGITSSSSQFAVSPSSSVSSSGVLQVRIRFTPVSEGAKVATITIASNDPDEPTLTLSAKGTGNPIPEPDIRVTPAYLDFGDVEMGASLGKKFEIHNDGALTLQISSMAVNNNQFEVSNGLDISPGGMKEVTVTFTPSSLGIETGKVTITSNDPNEPTTTVSLTGEGIQQPGPEIYVAPQNLDFGEVDLGQILEMSFFIYNFGNEILQIYSITSSASQFVVLDHPNVTPGSAVEVWIRFIPSSSGTRTGQITINSNDSDEPAVTVQLSGSGAYPDYPIVGDWQLIHQQDAIQELHDINFANDSDGWVVGSSGVILHSGNGGETWTNQQSGTNITLKGVHFTNSSKGWAVGHYGTILRTTNGGQTWSFWTSGVSNDLNAVQFLDNNYGWAVGSSGIVLATTNGSNWTAKDSETQFDLHDVCFVNSQDGWAVGNYGTILRSTNGGQTWIPQNSGTTAGLYGVYFANHYEGWIVGSYGMILHTLDGGQTWMRQSNGVPYTILTDVDFVSTNEGWAVGYSGVMLYTQDGGYKWSRVDNVVNDNLRAVQFRDSERGWAVGAYGTILRHYPEAAPPVIAWVNVTGSPAKTGDIIKVTATGQSGNQATFSINGVVSNVEMPEYPSGTYIGSYSVVDGANINSALVTVALRNQYGDIATNSDHSVTIDTTARINWASVTPTVAKSDDVVVVSMGGEADGIAKFSIDGISANINMAEDTDTPGSYRGQYTIPAGVNSDGAEVTVELTDLMGNVDTKYAGQIIIDTIAKITSVSVDGSPAKLGDPITVTLAGEAGGKAKFYVSGLASDLAMSENQPGVYTGSYTAPAGTSVSNVIVRVQLTDALGNIATQNAGAIAIDTESEINSVTVSGSPAKSGDIIGVVLVGEQGGAAQFSIAGITGNIPMTEDTPGLYKGIYTAVSGDNVDDAVVTVTLTDPLGNTATNTENVITIDTTAPAIASTNISGSPAKLGKGVEATAIGESGATAVFSIAGVTENVPMTEDQPGIYTGTFTITDGINADNATVTISLSDAVGNMSTNTGQFVTIDTIAPEINSVSVSGSPAKTGETITVVILAEPGCFAEFSIDGAVENVSMTENPPGTYTGTYTADESSVTAAILTAKLSDPIGNISTDSTQSVTIDADIPLIASVIVTGSPAKAGDTITVTVVGEVGILGSFAIAGVTADVSLTEDAPGIYTGAYVVTEGTDVADAEVTVTLTDTVGNIATESSQQVTIDTTVPQITSVSAPGSPAKAGDTLGVTVFGSPGVSAQFFIDGIIDNAPMPEVADLPGTYMGTYSVVDGINVTDAVVTVILTDSVGNVSVDASQRMTIDTMAPEISSVIISGSPAKVGDTVGISVISESGGNAKFTVADMAENLSLVEDADQQGTYTGEFIVTKEGDCATEIDVVVTLADAAGNISTDSSAKFTICQTWDVNSDGSVDTDDLLVIGESFGQTAEAGSDADVNSDGQIDILDLIIVCKNFGSSEAATSPARTMVADSEQLPMLRKLYESIAGNSKDAIMAKRLLAQLIGLPEIQVTKSRLMQNYPNPCNPETWIPYELAKSGTVTLNIYAPAGQLIRTLYLGHKAAGSYFNTDKAAHWDGLNEAGEKVSSGIYFYTIKSSDFSAVRKLIISR